MRIGQNKNEEGQAKINFNFNQSEQIDKKDSKGRTRSDIIQKSKSLNKQVIDSISFKDGEYYIEGILADKWISQNNYLYEKTDQDFLRGQA